ncbi:Helicase conserved C-terminal domain-containing protein [Modestobacter sp. DSM 44400]|uniref:helicase-associated domain-containing protein n=1 Tax=Modestobacter sp. DSM 44400 TaxID=1550230 RepID=UPI0008968A2C|nr:helicase-associated domain-containing protein [Modestobacter sp. DSM 44400]SDY38398.1 Helicase conserved C-terminal domain-containing protein [Modestobacter sp. DSM 44400]
MAEHRGLADWLAGLDQDALAELLTRRPDAVTGRPPGSLGELAERLTHPESVAATLRGLPAPFLQMVEALHALGECRTTTALIDLLDDAGRGTDHPTAVRAVLTELTRLAVVWPGPGDEWETPARLSELFPKPLDLDPPLRELWREQTADTINRTLRLLGHQRVGRKAESLDLLLAVLSTPETVRALAAQAPAQVAADLERLAQTGSADDEPEDRYDQRAYRRKAATRQWGMEHGLLVGPSWGNECWLPAEIALALRGPAYRAPFTPDRPAVPARETATGVVESAAAAAATQFAGYAIALLDRMARAPVPQLASGGIGVRELTRLAKETGATEPEVRLVLELAAAAELIEPGEQVHVGSRFGAWRAAEPAAQLAALLLAWWRLPAVPTDSRDADGKALRALRARGTCAGCLAARMVLLQAASTVPPGSAATDPAAVAAVALWERPLVHVLAQDADTPLRTSWREAELLGVLGAGALSPAGAALLTGDVEALGEQLTRMLPASSDQAMFGSDLTVLVAGSPSARVTTLLDGCADRESRGGATTWRFSPTSVRRALDEGMTADALLEQLAACAARELPQPLRFLIADVARRHGRLRLLPAASVIRSEDTALLAEVAADRRLTKLGLHVIAPTVLASTVPLDAALARLREVGYFPVAEPTSEGVGAAPTDVPDDDTPSRVTVLRSALRSLQGRPGRTEAAGPVNPTELARRLANGSTAPPPPVSDVALALAGVAPRLTGSEIDQLAHAIETDAPVRIQYESPSGAVTSRVITDVELSGPMLYAWCKLRQDERVFTLARIRSVSAVG